jgi:hypothetical protein
MVQQNLSKYIFFERKYKKVIKLAFMLQPSNIQKKQKEFKLIINTSSLQILLFVFFSIFE